LVRGLPSIGRWAVAVVVVACATAPAPKKAPEREATAMIKKTEWAAQYLTSFAKTKAVESLLDAIEKLEDIGASELPPSPAAQQTRREVLEAWLQVIAAIDGSLDPAFDPANVPAGNLIPPPSGGGIGYPAGVDPKAIADPQARAAYEAALTKNREKAESYNLQTHLRLFDSQASKDVDRFVASYYHSTVPGDRGEIDQACDAVSLSKARRARILSHLA
jgi:hypothetical protein